MREQANVLIVGADRDATRAVAKAYAALSGARVLDLDDYIAYTLGRSPEAALQVVDRAYVERVVGNCGVSDDIAFVRLSGADRTYADRLSRIGERDGATQGDRPLCGAVSRLVPRQKDGDGGATGIVAGCGAE